MESEGFGAEAESKARTEGGQQKLNRSRWESAEGRKAEFLELFVEIGDPVQVAAKMGMAVQTYYRWRQRDELFRAKAIQVQSMLRDVERGFKGGFVEHRKVFFGNDSALHHIRTIELIEAALPGSVTMFLYAPEHGKTTLTEDYDCYLIDQNRDMRITVGSEGQPHARKILHRVKKRMTDRNVARAFVDERGPFYRPGQEREGKPWGADYFTVSGARHDERDYTMEARGMRSAIAGTRTDLLQVDDAQSRRSLNLTDTLVETFRQDWLSRPGQTGKTIILGTRVGDWDFYEALQKEGIVDNLITFPAILSDGSPLWPERWPLDKLMKQKAIVGETAWWRNYMQAPRNGATATFPEDTIASCHNRLLSTLVPDSATETWRGARVLSLDPALGGGNSMCVAEMAPDRMRVRMSRSDYGLSRVEQILDLVDDVAFRYRPVVMVIEENAFQRAFVNDDRLRAIASRYGFRVVPHQTNVNKHDEDFGVAAMATDFLTRRIELPYADDASIKMTNELASELMAWRPHVKGTRLRMDRVMSLWFCWLEWRKIARLGTTSSDPGAFQRRGLPWTPTRTLVGTGAR